MSLLKQIETLRNRSEAERKRAALRLSIAITSVIAIFWIGFLFLKAAHQDLVAKIDTATSTTPGISEIFSSFVAGVGKIFESGSKQFETLTKPEVQVEEEAQTEPQQVSNNGQESTHFDLSGVESNQ